MSEINQERVLLTGNQAIARGFFEAGGLVAASYPGSPTVEILESVKPYKEIYSEFSVSEKVALEVAIGGSFSGVRSMASMKHVGVNIAADPLMTFTQTPTNGGFLLVTGDDPGLNSSQNEQDNRILGKFANMPILDPSDSQEAKDFVKTGLQISEDFQTPIMLRITSRLCHSRSAVLIEERKEVSSKDMISDRNMYCMIPPNSNRQQFFMKERLENLTKSDYLEKLNKLEKNNSKTLIITSGIVYNNLKELNLNVDILKLGLIYPLEEDYLKKIVKNYTNVIVIEEMTGFLENELKTMGINCEGKKYFSFTGELGSELIEKGLFDAGVIQKAQAQMVTKDVTKRLPLFCSGCPHRPIFDILKKSKVKTIFGDIGCYSMAFLHPFEQSNSIISMGACLGIIKGAVKSTSLTGKKEPLVAVIGDGTLFHSGLPGILNLMHNKEKDENLTIIILDNRTTAMTGGQPNASSGSFDKNNPMNVDIKALLEVMGFDRIIEIHQFNYKESKKIIETEIKHEGLSIIIAKEPCALHYKIKEPHFYVDPNICIGCRSCIRTNCPPLKMKKYEGIEKQKSSIDENMCVGCSVCEQVCPVTAILPSKKGGKKDE